MVTATPAEPTQVASDELVAQAAEYLWGRQISRRRLMQSGAWAALAAVLTGPTLAACQPVLNALLEQIKNRPVRRDISTLEPTHPIIAAYEAAITKMKAKPTSDCRNWTRQAQIHYDFCPHHNWLFLPWHRVYMRYFEEIIREESGDSTFALPYWNWIANPVVPDVFKNPSSPLYVDPADRPGGNTILPSWIFNATNIDHILDEPNFLLFASGAIPAGSTNQRANVSQGPLESGPHNNVHSTISGIMGSFMSPLDPVFWTHHNMIDLLWVNWNITRGNPNTNDTNWVNWKFTEFCKADGTPVEATVLESILYPYFTYRFDDPTLGGII